MLLLRSIQLITVSVGFSLGSLSPQFIMARLVLVNNCSEAMIWSLHRAVDQGQLRDVVLVNHTEDWLLLDPVHGRVLHVIGVHGRGLVEAIGGYQLRRVVLRHSVDPVQGPGQTSRCEAVDRWLELSFL